MDKKKISNWGNYPKVKSTVSNFENIDDLKKILASGVPLIARGMGRSYGDASLGESILSTTSYQKIISFDSKAGIIHCESGVTLEEILERIIPQGWFLPVTPGTKYVSIGGAIAADIHGKNHHIHGSFSGFIESLNLMLESGEILTCSIEENQELYHATIGGMGLTGIILDAKIKLQKIETSYILQHIKPCRNLEEMLREINASSISTYSVAWIDCLAKNNLGKGILFTGEHASQQDLDDEKKKNPLAVKHKQKLKIPFYFPGFVLNKWNIKCFNILYFKMQCRKKGTQVVNYNIFFYPLDGIKDWNKIYGKRGFVQYQLVIPKKHGYEGLHLILTRIQESGYGSFLSVLKLLGAKSGMIAFPEPGYTLALDFAVNKKVFLLIQELDEIVKNLGGKIYLAKDACLEPHNFEKMYSRIEQFRDICKKYNPRSTFQSRLSQRLNLLNKSNMKTVLILGAKSDIAKALAKKFIGKGFHLQLAARNSHELTDFVQTLQSEKTQVSVLEFDALNFKSHATFFEQLETKPEVLVTCFGYLGEQSLAETNFEEAQKVIDTNFTGAVSIIEIAARYMEQKKKGSIIAISSVAGDRGKKSNYMYGAAKAALTTYLSGLRQRLAPSSVHVLTVKPGFVYTQMTEGMKLPKSLTAHPDKVASDIFRAYKKRKGVVYTKPFWRVIMLIIRNIPEFIFKKLDL